MSNLNAPQILNISSELYSSPRHTKAEINSLAKELGGAFPPAFDRLMRQTGGGFTKHKTRFLTLSKIPQETESAIDIMTHDFSLPIPKNMVVFQWSDVYAFAYFSAIGTDHVPVFEFNYNSGTHPVLIGNTVPDGLALCLRQLLDLG